MSETLRDLVVSLSLNSDNFTRNIKSINKQIQEAQSAFQLAGAGVEGFESTAEGLSSKLATLRTTLSLQKDAVSQYERALTQANDRLREYYDRQNDYAQRLTDAKAKQAELKNEVARTAAQHKQYVQTLGESDSATIASKANLDALKEEYRASVQQVKLLKGQNIALAKATQNAADAVSAAQTKYNGARAAVKEAGAQIEKCSAALALSATNWEQAGKTITQTEQGLLTIGKQIKQAESRFRLAAAGVKDFDSSAQGLTAKLTLLEEKLALQTDAVEQYERRLAAAKEQLAAAQAVNDPEKIRQATDAVIDAQTALTDAQAAVQKTRAEIEATNQALKTAQSSWTAAGKSLESFGKACDTASRNMEKTGRVLTTAITTPVVALGTAAIKASIDFESSFASVRKTVDATEAEFGTLAAASKKMSTQIATSTDEINEVMATGGQLGIANQYLTDFTRTMIDLGNSCEDLDAAEAASSIAQFANVMGTNQSLFSNIGSTIVALGNNFATTERPIMEMAQRLAGAGKQVGLTEAQILGFATAFSSVGIAAEMGGSAFSKALIKMEVACAMGGESLDDFGKVCGMTGEQFKALFDTDPAAAFQKFIVSLAQMDEEGESAIAVLNEIGIAEVRLRDTMLRAVNATELFSSAQAMANEAWDENTALTEEASKRYATTESKLKNLKNTALLFGQQIGDDLNPTIQALIDGAGDLLLQFMELDESQRMQIIRFAAYAAAAGPVVLTLGKVTKGVGAAAAGIGKFSAAVGKAGGGMSGLMTVLGKSPAVWMAVAAAVIVGTAALADYVSGAKQARDALEGMTQTAQKWKETAAQTFYGSSDGLSFFGMNKEEFVRDKQSMQDWMDGLIAVWTDGQLESDEIVSQWTESFKALTASTREELVALKAVADASGYGSVSADLAGDIEALDQMDAEIERLLKKRQSKYFSDADKIRLQELIDTREAIEIKYQLSPAETDGFDTIARKVEAEVARAQARGQADADVSVYENAMVAAAEGLAAVNAQIDAQYDKEYAVIQLIEDSAERQAALEALNARYLDNRRDAALEYAQTLSGVVMPVWEQENIQQAASDVEQLTQLLRQYSAAMPSERPAILESIHALTEGMDESSLTEYIAMLTQIQSLLDSGMSEAEIQAAFPEIDFSTALAQIASIQAFLNRRELELPALNTMFSDALPEEVLKIATDLDMTGAQERWNEFAAQPGAITTEAILSKISENEETEKIQPQVEAFISKYTEVEDGADTASLTPEGLVAYVTAYAEATGGADVSGLTPQNVTAIVSAYEELSKGADVSALKPDEITAYISKYLEEAGVDTTGLAPTGITAAVMAYEEATGGALTTALTPGDVTAMVVKYLEADGVDVSALSPGQIEAIVSSFAEATNCDKSALLQDFTAYIARYDDTNAVKPQLSMSVGIYGYDLMAYRKFIAENPVEVQGVVKLGEVYGDPTQALADPQTKFYQNGQEIPVTAVPTELLTADKVAVLGEDGTLHVLIAPEITGTQEAIDAISPLVDEVDQLGVTAAGMFAGIMPQTTMDMIGSAVERINSYTSSLDYTGWERFWASLRGESTDQGVLNQSMTNDFTPERVAELSAYVGEVVSAIQQGKQVSETDIQNLQDILTFLQGLDTTQTGTHILEGVGEGMTAAGWDTDAETVASNLEAALNLALGIQSPSTRVKPVGSNVSAGVGVGMTEFDFAADSATAAANLTTAIETAMPGTLLATAGTNTMEGIAAAMTGYSFVSAGNSVGNGVKTAVSGSLNSATLRPAGVDAMAGLKAGINAGRSGVITAMRSAARAAVNAAKAELKIRSPSQVFADEVGAMAMRGFGIGAIKESKEQARAVRNASRYLTDAAKDGAITYATSDNRRTYNNTQSVNVTVQSMQVRDEQDVHALAVEIATLTRRQQRGRGLRFA